MEDNTLKGQNYKHLKLITCIFPIIGFFIGAMYYDKNNELTHDFLSSALVSLGIQVLIFIIVIVAIIGHSYAY